MLKAKASITPDTAIKFERALGMPCDYWLNLEANYQAVLARLAEERQLEQLWPNLSVAYRQHNKHEIFPEAVSAWLRQGEIQATEMACEAFDKGRFRQVLDNVRALTTNDPKDFVPELERLCAQAGVAVVFVPSLPKTGISGATRWLNKDKAIIQLSLRYRSDDHLWFTFFHEAGHILLHGKKRRF